METLSDCQAADKPDQRIDLQNCAEYFRAEQSHPDLALREIDRMGDHARSRSYFRCCDWLGLAGFPRVSEPIWSAERIGAEDAIRPSPSIKRRVTPSACNPTYGLLPSPAGTKPHHWRRQPKTSLKEAPPLILFQQPPGHAAMRTPRASNETADNSRT
jgi:hypothetical protein